MNIKEFGSWSPFNKDNPKYSPDEYNRSFIKERFEPAGEYDGSDFDEYYQPPKMADSYNYNSDKKEEESDKKGKNKNSQQLRQNLLGRVVCLAAGSVIITTSYQSVMKQQQNIPEPPITPPHVQTQDIPATVRAWHPLYFDYTKHLRLRSLLRPYRRMLWPNP